ncbi:TetR/AcrR family transcriptional regulator [Micropruina sp.]|uniref:TetR/AcrR family transcriptional regulator n=1 Tax=Micropruina sp. TaxID=2737536 RepID=UPI0039E4320A
MPIASPKPPRKPRADAERNRRSVLDAASVVFASRGPAATLEEVAQAAGVGVGTIYRKFCDKQALLDALFDDKAASFRRPALEAVRIADPGDAFRSYLSGLMELLASDQSLMTVLFGPGRHARFPSDLGEETASTVDGLIGAAIAAGELHEGFTRQDAVVLGAMVGRVAGATREEHPELWRRYAQLIVDGTRTSGHEPLRQGALPFPDTVRAMGHML